MLSYRMTSRPYILLVPFGLCLPSESVPTPLAYDVGPASCLRCADRQRLEVGQMRVPTRPTDTTGVRRSDSRTDISSAQLRKDEYETLAAKAQVRAVTCFRS